jgi:hypothetical protein
MYIYVCIHTYVCILTYVYSCMYTYVCILMYVYSCMYTHVCILMYVYSCMYTHVCILMYVSSCMYTHVCIPLYVYPCIRTPSRSTFSVSFPLAGTKKVYITVTTNTGEVVEVEDRDEIKLFLRGRYLSSMDAMWRVLKFKTYPESQPSVCTIKIKTPDEMNDLIDSGLNCAMSIYFNRPRELADYTFVNLFERFIGGALKKYAYMHTYVCI